jgi:hypothetical protein
MVKVPAPLLVTFPAKASPALISCVPLATVIEPLVPLPTVSVPPLPEAIV